jgi:Protein of unknown function (DUF2442)
MSTSGVAAEPMAVSAKVTRDTLVVELRDGRVLSVPLAWYPRLAAATASERRRWELIGPGIGIHWPLIDEDVSIEALMAGRRSTESVSSLRRWEASRRPANRALQPASRAAKSSRTRRVSSTARG